MKKTLKDLYSAAEKSSQFLSNSKESKEKIILEKFAESIINECITICERGESTQMTSKGAADQIRQYFNA